MHISKIKPNTLETIDTLRRSPRWRSPIETEILPTKEAALHAEKEREVNVKVYSDGSGQDGQIGAAAVLVYGHREPRVARHYLGLDTEHTVYEGECVGQLLALGLIQQTKANLSHADTAFMVDNQPSIRAHHSRRPRPGSYIINGIHDSYQKTHNRHNGISIKIHWIPSHKGIHFSDAVDEEAKKAAKGAQYNCNNQVSILRRPLPISRSAKRQHLKASTKKQYSRKFKKLSRFRKIESIDPSTPSNKFRKMTATLSRRQKSILIQLRTEHIPLQAYLHRIGKVESPTCQQCNEEAETVSHYIRRCHAYKGQRRELMTSTGERHDISSDILGRKETVRQVLKYIADTKRFEESHGDLTPKMQEEAEQEEQRVADEVWA